MKIPADVLKQLLEAIAEGATVDPYGVLKTVIMFFAEQGLTAAEILPQLVQLGYSSC